MDAVEQRFQICISSILEHEGGLTMDRRDPGGTTNWGISLRYLKSVGLDLNHDGIINDEDIIHLSKEGAEAIYRKYWWEKYNYAEFNKIVVVEKVFDMAVNMGAITAHRLLQEAINCIISDFVVVDGILGENTFNSANCLNGDTLRQKLRDCARSHYERILAANPAMEWARKGWMKRAAW